MGDTGSDWLLLLNEDDGQMEWQTRDWTTIPNHVAKQMNNCVKKGRYVKEVDFGPVGGWYIHGIKRDNTGGHAWWGETAAATSDLKTCSTKPNQLQVSFGSDSYGSETYALLIGQNGHSLSSNLNDCLAQRIERLHNQSKTIKFIRLFANDGYFISDEEGMESINVGEHCESELLEAGQVEDIAVAGDKSWVVIRPNHFHSSTGVDDRLVERLARFYCEQRQRVERRKQEICAYQERIGRERRQREEREAAEWAADEAWEAECKVMEAEERAQREAMEATERAQHEAQEATAVKEIAGIDKKADKHVEAGKFEQVVDRAWKEEVQNIREIEEQVHKQKRAVQAYLQELPASRRFRLDDNLSSPEGVPEGKAECVVCQDNAASRAVVPCGHHCLCDECAGLLESSTTSRLCPLCRGVLTSTLKIFTLK